MILKKRILKKRLGSLDQMLVSALAFIIEATLIVAVVNIFNLTTYKDRLDQAVRAYVLVLETKGELNKQSVADGLTADGFSVNASDIVINDGKSGKANYGDTVSIKVEYDASGDEIGFLGSVLNKSYHINVYRESISKARWIYVVT